MSNRGMSDRLEHEAEIRELREKLAEAEETLRAIREGEVDAIVVAGKAGEQVFSLTGSEQVYRLIVETMKEAALTVTFEQVILYCNAQLGQFLGVPQEKIVGHRLEEFVAPDQASFIPDLITRSAKAPVKQRLVFQSQGKTPVPAHISASVLNQPDGVSICIVATDLTELENSTEMLQRLRRQQEALLDSESRLRAVFAVSPDAILIADDEGRIVEANPATNRLLGFNDVQGVIGKPIGQFVPVHLERIWAEFRAHGCYQSELHLIRKDGTDRLVEAFAVADIRPSRHLVVLHDITEKTKAEQALKASHNLLEQKVEERTSELADVIGRLQKEIRRREVAETGLRQTNRLLRMVGECNEAIVRIEDEHQLMSELCRIIVEVGDYRFAWVGFAEGEEDKTVTPIAYAGLDGDYLESARIRWDDTERGQGPTGRAIRTGKVQFVRDYLHDPALVPWRELAVQRGVRSSIALPLSDREKVFGALTIYSAGQDAFGEPEGKILNELAEDLAYGFLALRTRKALRESRDRLRQMGAELTRAEQRERERIAGILHDHIQQLLVATKYRVAAIKEKDLAAGTREVQELLDKSIEASRTLTAELSPPALKEGLAASLSWLAESMSEKYGLEVDLDMDVGVSPLLEDIKTLLFESARELLFNVAKHAQVKAARLSLHKLGNDFAEIVVQDSGIGFDPAVLATCRASGIGFGLQSLRQRIDLIGGQVTITSKPGKGSRFVLTIPTRPQPAS